MSLFRCPVCGQALSRDESGYLCPSGHRYDLARQGYVHLLPANRMHSRLPGDDAKMVEARADFLSKGYYAPLLDALCAAAAKSLSGVPAPAVLDCGCGEGYYTQGIYETLRDAGEQPRIAGIDISKFALRRAARRCPEGEFAVASAYRLPVANDSCDLLLDVFAPLSAEEFGRVLRPGGTFVYVVPSARHLWQMKQVLYREPYENPVQETPYPGFRYREIAPVRGEITLPCREDIAALFQMTPYCWNTPKAGVDALNALETLKTEIAFDLHIFEKL